MTTLATGCFIGGLYRVRSCFVQQSNSCTQAITILVFRMPKRSALGVQRNRSSKQSRLWGTGSSNSTTLQACFWDILPDEIAVKILGELPVTERLRLEICCRKWRLLIPYSNCGIVDSKILGDKENLLNTMRLLACLARKCSTKQVNVRGLSLEAFRASADMQPIHQLSEISPAFVTHLNLGSHDLTRSMLTVINASFKNLQFMGFRCFALNSSVRPDDDQVTEFTQTMANLRELQCSEWRAPCLPAGLKRLRIKHFRVTCLETLLATSPSLQSVHIISIQNSLAKRDGFDDQRLPYMAALREFVSHCHSVNIMPMVTQRCPNLQCLEIDTNFYQEVVNADPVCPLRQLKKFVAVGLHVDKMTFLWKLDAIGLTHLHIHNVRAFDDDAVQMAATLFPKLRTFDVKDCTHATGRTLTSVFGMCTELELLDFAGSSNYFRSTINNVPPLVASAILPTLKECLISKCYFSEPTTAAVTRCPNLESLKLWDADMSTVQECQPLPNLRELFLCRTRHQITPLLQSIQPVSLENIDLASVFPFSDEILRLIAARFHDTLQTLQIQNCAFSGIGIKEIFLHCRSLRSVDIINCSMTDPVGFAALANASTSLVSCKIVPSIGLKPKLCTEALVEQLKLAPGGVTPRNPPIRIVTSWLRHYIPWKALELLETSGFTFESPSDEDKARCKGW